MAVGDLVLLKYPGQFKDDYTIAKVTEVHPSEDNLVRKVTIDYRKRRWGHQNITEQHTF